MTISQALRRIKRLKGRMAELTARAAGVVSYEAGKKPAFDFRATRAEVATVRDELVTLEAAVAAANATTTVSVGDQRMTVAAAVRRLQELRAEMAWLAGLTLRAGVVHLGAEWCYDDGSGRNIPRAREATYISDLSETDRAAELDALRTRFEGLNDAVESANHRTPVEVAAS